MPVEFTARYFDANDPDDHLARRIAGAGTRPETAGESESSSPWVDPDYASIPADEDLPADEADRRLVWPGPAMIMPGDLLPDGQPPGYTWRENVPRICGRQPRSNAEAEAISWAYDRQQDALRKQAGLPRAEYGRTVLEDTPETIERIKQLHAEERARRRLRQGHRRAG
jgi:hypothetical protein